jgi:hypothetical protein
VEYAHQNITAPHLSMISQQRNMHKQKPRRSGQSDGAGLLPVLVLSLVTRPLQVARCVSRVAPCVSCSKTVYHHPKVFLRACLTVARPYPSVPQMPKKTRKRTATFSSGLLDIAAEDRRGFRLRRLAFFCWRSVFALAYSETGLHSGLR